MWISIYMGNIVISKIVISGFHCSMRSMNWTGTGILCFQNITQWLLAINSRRGCHTSAAVRAPTHLSKCILITNHISRLERGKMRYGSYFRRPLAQWNTVVCDQHVLTNIWLSTESIASLMTSTLLLSDFFALYTVWFVFSDLLPEPQFSFLLTCVSV